MASVDLHMTAKKDWIFASPWIWLSAGGILTLWSFLWTVVFGESANDYRIIVLALDCSRRGSAFGCAGMTVRPFIYCLARSCWPGSARTSMGLVFALVGLGITLLFCATIFLPDQLGWKPALPRWFG